MCHKVINWWFVVTFSMKEHLANTRDAIDLRENMANILENHFSTLEKTLLNMQLRLHQLIQQWQGPIASFPSLILTVFIYPCIVRQCSKCMHAQDYVSTLCTLCDQNDNQSNTCNLESEEINKPHIIREMWWACSCFRFLFCTPVFHVEILWVTPTASCKTTRHSWSLEQRRRFNIHEKHFHASTCKTHVTQHEYQAAWIFI